MEGKKHVVISMDLSSIGTNTLVQELLNRGETDAMDIVFLRVLAKQLFPNTKFEIFRNNCKND